METDIGKRTTPSIKVYTKNEDRLVGQIAKRQAVVNPKNTFFSVKRFIGRKMIEVDEEAKQVSYNVIRDENGNVKLDCPAMGKQFAAEEISAQVVVTTRELDSVTLHGCFTPLDKGLDKFSGGFIWDSEKTGFKHLYLHNASGKFLKAITQGDWMVEEIAGVDEAAALFILLKP
ncbi:hypothetical protein AgCh_034369 [Apium graveolens]